MTGMLASVTSPEEAQIVWHAGADIIDLKAPENGALGALPLTTITAITAKFTNTVAISATIGDLPMVPECIGRMVSATAKAGVDYVKIGLFEDARRADCIRSLEPLCRKGIRIVIVMFADQNPDLDLLPLIAASGCTGVMLDTADKHSGGLLECLEPTQLSAFVEKARELNLLTGLAGSLRAVDIARLLPVTPDYLGFRGALCHRSQRTGTIDPAAVSAIRALIPKIPSDRVMSL
jgi:dihydroneopterin aldolase